MAVTTYWMPNQAAIAQVETYTFAVPNSVGNTYNATLNGKTVTYTSVAADTAALVATGLFNLLNVTTGIAAEFTEITFANSVAGQMTATAQVPGTPFANVPGTSAGLVLSTGNGLMNGITTVHTQANQSPSDVNDPQNWLRYNFSNTPPSSTRALPQNTDNVVVNNTNVPMLWNLDQLVLVQFNTYTRWQTMTGDIGLPVVNVLGYNEWRATDFKFAGPQGSVPAGGLQMVLGYGAGSGPANESYNLGSQQVTLTIIAGGTINFTGVHTANTFTQLGGTTLNIAMDQGETSTLSSSTVDGGSTLNIGPNVTWTAASTLTMIGGSAVINAAPAMLSLANGAQVVFPTDALTWPTITAQGSCRLTWLAGGVITALTMTTGCVLDKSADARTLTITNSIIDGDSCQFIDPLNALVFTNATTVKQQVTSGPFQFMGQRTMKLT